MSGRVWKFGDDVDTDALAPGAYMKFGMDTLAAHCLESLRPDFARSVQIGDVVVAGRNFGIGSSREQAPQALKHLGVAAVVAVSFAGLFYRNALNLGLAVLVCRDVDQLADGSVIEVDPQTGRLLVQGMAEPVRCEPIPGFLLAMVRAGGLLPHLEARLKKAASR